MKRLKHILVLGSLVSVLASCGKGLLNDAGRYVKYIDDKDHGLIQEQMSGNVKFVAACRPSAYMAVKELGARLDAASLQKRIHETGDNLTIAFRIMSEDGAQDILKSEASPQEYLQRITHMTGPIQQNFFLLEGNDTIPCAFSHFERAYNVTPYNELLLGFESGLDDGKDKVLLYRDQLFGLEYFKFSFSASDIKRIPQLTL